MLLDLTVAFDTVDHEILNFSFGTVGGINGIALEWFRFYLEGWTFCVSCGDCVLLSLVGYHRAQF